MNTVNRKLIDYLLLKSLYMQNAGLFHGKMGIVVALYAYADRYHDKLLEEYAWELFLQVYDDIHADMPIGLEYGLSGIGYGTALLCKLGLVECDLNEILADVDAKIMERDPRRMTDFSARSGMGGLLLYLSLRQETSGSLSTFDSQYLAELHAAATDRGIVNMTANIIDLLNEPSFAVNDYMEKPVGIDGGSAYYILKDIIA